MWIFIYFFNLFHPHNLDISNIPCSRHSHEPHKAIMVSDTLKKKRRFKSTLLSKSTWKKSKYQWHKTVIVPFFFKECHCPSACNVRPSTHFHPGAAHQTSSHSPAGNTHWCAAISIPIPVCFQVPLLPMFTSLSISLGGCVHLLCPPTAPHPAHLSTRPYLNSSSCVFQQTLP